MNTKAFGQVLIPALAGIFIAACGGRAAGRHQDDYIPGKILRRVEHLQNVSPGTLRLLEDDPSQPHAPGCQKEPRCHHRPDQ